MKQYLKLLIQREKETVLGSHWFNMWVLSGVLFCTFLAIAFSNASMEFLEDKMNDPFTKWVNIPQSSESEHFADFKSAIKEEDCASHYNYSSNVAEDVYNSKKIVRKDLVSSFYLTIRFFDHFDSELVKAVVSEDNLIQSFGSLNENIDDESLGLILTQDALMNLGYSVDSIPAYVCFAANSDGVEDLGVNLHGNDFYPIPLPVLAVVRRLPMNMDIIASRKLDNYIYSGDKPFLIVRNPDYLKDLYYYFDGTLSQFESVVTPLFSTNYSSILPFSEEDIPEMRNWKGGTFIKVNLTDTEDFPVSEYEDFNQKVLHAFPADRIQRIYRYKSTDYLRKTTNFISLNFSSLDSIRSFEKYVKSEFGIQIEMSQINAKENFNAVSVMANILSMAMIVFSIACIILFIVNMMQNYFQKVKRNMGTFRAFGMSSQELILIYIRILFFIILAAIIIALLGTSLVQFILHVFGVLRDGRYDYFSLWSSSTIWFAIFIILVATVTTVYVVMRRLLRQTPGDLIYDR